MKKFALAAGLMVILFSWTGLPEAPVPVVDSAPAALLPVTDAPISTAAFPPILPLPECGERCFNPGQQRGCVDRRFGTPRRVPCQCSGGYWQCF
ncbi:MAG: hypothetical protein AAF604_15050 [Acidobacteriota bacterium]